MAVTGCSTEYSLYGTDSTAAAATFEGRTAEPTGAASTSTGTAPAKRRTSSPSLVVTEEPADVVYEPGSRDSILKRMASASFNPFTMNEPPVETLITRKVRDLAKDYNKLKKNIEQDATQLDALQRANSADAADYYEMFASISSRLQAGSTPGNPRLVERWNVAQENLNELAQNTTLMNQLAQDVANEASRAAFLLEATRATFGLSGAVEEDHEKLREVEDEINELIVQIDRLLNEINDEINRRTTYLRAERLNMQTLALAVANGELYGQSITNRLFTRAANAAGVVSGRGPEVSQPAKPQTRRPLVVIRFDQPNVEYEQAVYMAINQGLEKFPDAQFDLVAVSPSSGNPAQVALAATAAKKNAEAVLRTLTQIGVPMERINLSAANSRSASSSEVHIYIR